jgi:alkylhydroperoxidase family enzyme
LSASIEPPKQIMWLLRFGIWFSKKVTGKDILVAKLLSWYPKAAFGSAMLESLVAHHDKAITERILKLVRIQASFSASCPFCIDMNSFEFEKFGITVQEFSALKNNGSLAEIVSMTKRERLAVEYARLISQTPLAFPAEFIDALKETFGEREIVILASTAAQVNYWARLNSALGVPPAGFTEICKVNQLTDDSVKI